MSQQQQPKQPYTEPKVTTYGTIQEATQERKGCVASMMPLIKG